AEVSALEEELAKILAISESEGRIARRGAVRAALKAGDFSRAYALVECYTSENNAPGTLKTELGKKLKEGDQAITRRFRYAAKHHSLREARDFARRFRESGAFGLAA